MQCNECGLEWTPSEDRDDDDCPRCGDRGDAPIPRRNPRVPADTRWVITRQMVNGQVTYTILTGTPDNPMPTKVSQSWAEHRVAQGHARYVDGYGMPAADAVPSHPNDKERS